MMPTIWNFDGDDQTNSGGGSQYFRIDTGRSEENINNGNEGGLRIENEDGVELWFSADEASNDGNSYMAWIDVSGNVTRATDGVWNDTKTGDGNLYHAASNGTNFSLSLSQRNGPEAFCVLDPFNFSQRPRQYWTIAKESKTPKSL